MKRELKFRAWDKKRSMIHYNAESFDVVQPVFEDGEEYTFAELLHDENFIVMQFTGLKDKNGKEIYEGDVIRFTYETGATMNIEIGAVRFSKAGFWTSQPDGFYEEVLDNELRELEGEVIGNIYSTPELLRYDPS